MQAPMLVRALSLWAASALAFTMMGCGADDAERVTPSTATPPPPAPEPEPEPDPATTPVPEECERDSDCVVYLGSCDQWYAVRAGTEAAYEEGLRETVDELGCPVSGGDGPGPRPEVECQHGHCERVEPQP